MFEHILLAVDGSTLSQSAFNMTLHLARKLGARVTALRVYPEYPLHGQVNQLDYIPVDAPAIAADAREEVDRYLRVLAHQASERHVPFGAIGRPGAHPYDVIIRVAQELGCDLIVMASHGRRGVQALLLGSETQRVLTHSKISVLVMR